MDLSLIVLAMFRISSKERLPLCLTESNYNINSNCKRNMKEHKPTLKKGWLEKSFLWLNGCYSIHVLFQVVAVAPPPPAPLYCKTDPEHLEDRHKLQVS
jgi:hypothetical protein